MREKIADVRARSVAWENRAKELERELAKARERCAALSLVFGVCGFAVGALVVWVL